MQELQTFAVSPSICIKLVVLSHHVQTFAVSPSICIKLVVLSHHVPEHRVATLSVNVLGN